MTELATQGSWPCGTLSNIDTLALALSHVEKVKRLGQLSGRHAVRKPRLKAMLSVEGLAILLLIVMGMAGIDLFLWFKLRSRHRTSTLADDQHPD